MDEGNVAQVGPPQDFFARPVSARAARFFGWENLVGATQLGHKVHSTLGIFTRTDFDARSGAVLLAIRPDAAYNLGTGSIEGTVVEATFTGSQIAYRIDCTGVLLNLRVAARHNYAVGQTLSFDLDPSMLWTVAVEQARAEGIRQAR
ncbi:MAG: TOBE domain-containing protein [Coriobacteriales bacterium]|nr:TOBE domain-containing protein [Coriobacteriales bacterium]